MPRPLVALRGMGTLCYGDNLDILGRYVKHQTVTPSRPTVQLGPDLGFVLLYPNGCKRRELWNLRLKL